MNIHIDYYVYTENNEVRVTVSEPNPIVEYSHIDLVQSYNQMYCICGYSSIENINLIEKANIK